jgi:hypothetical protein
MLVRIAFLAATGGFLFGYDLGLIGGTASVQVCRAVCVFTTSAQARCAS